MFLAASSNITAAFRHPDQTSGETTIVWNFPFLTMWKSQRSILPDYTNMFSFLLSWSQMGTTDWVVALKIDPLLLDYILLKNHQQPTTYWPQTLVLADLLMSQWGDRKARCSSRQCSLVLITTSLSLQQTAYSLACHFRDNTINHLWTNSSCSHVSFPSSSTRTVSLLSRPKVWQTSAGYVSLSGWKEDYCEVYKLHCPCSSLHWSSSKQWTPASIQGLKVCMPINILPPCEKQFQGLLCPWPQHS